MTRIWITIIMVVFVAVAFAGCGGNEGGEAGTANDSQAAADAGTDDSQSADTAATTIDFETVDLEGNAVDSKDIFAENKITMINFWGTFCGPCIREMPEIEEIKKEYSEKGVGIVGVLVDVTLDDDSLAGDAKAIINDTGVTYRSFLGWSGFERLLPEGSIPTTWFVDTEGNVIGEHIVGADPQKYRKALDEYLSDK